MGVLPVIKRDHSGGGQFRGGDQGQKGSGSEQPVGERGLEEKPGGQRQKEQPDKGSQDHGVVKEQARQKGARTEEQQEQPPQSGRRPGLGDQDGVEEQRVQERDVDVDQQERQGKQRVRLHKKRPPFKMNGGTCSASYHRRPHKATRISRIFFLSCLGGEKKSGISCAFRRSTLY